MRILARLVALGASAVLLSTAGPLGPATADEAPPATSQALRQVGSLATAATSSYDGGNWAQPDQVQAYATPDGALAVARRVGEALAVDTYDAATLERTSSRTVTFPGWPRWGGVHVAPTGDLYVLVGRDNLEQDDRRDVVQVRRYAPDLTLRGTAEVQGGVSQGPKGIRVPFDAGAPHMALVGDRLVVHMSREMYTARDGLNHQGNLTFEVDTAAMVATTFQALGDYAYSSHSFQQLVAVHDGALVLVDHGDAYPRSVQLGVVPGYPARRDVTTHALFTFNGPVGANFTGASVSDVLSGPQGVVVLGSSIRHPDAPRGPLGHPQERRNAFALTATASGPTGVRWLTEFAAEGESSAGELRAVRLEDDRFAVLFPVLRGQGRGLEYRLLDSAGTVHASASLPGIAYSTISQPVLVGTTIHWVGTAEGDSTGYLYGLDVRDPASPRLDPRVLPRLALSASEVVHGTPVDVLVTGAPGAVVDLYTRAYPSTTFTRIRQGIVLDDTGTARIATRPHRNLRFKAVAVGTGRGSGEPLVRVAGTTSLSRATRTGPRRYVLSGSSRPPHPGQRVALYRNGVLLARTAVGSDGVYRFELTLPASTAGYQVTSPSTGYNAPSSSRSLTLTPR